MQFQEQKQLFDAAAPGSSFSVEIDGKKYDGTKGGENHENILNLSIDGKVHGYIDMLREIIITAETNVIFKLKEFILTIAGKVKEQKLSRRQQREAAKAAKAAGLPEPIVEEGEQGEEDEENEGLETENIEQGPQI